MADPGGSEASHRARHHHGTANRWDFRPGRASPLPPEHPEPGYTRRNQFTVTSFVKHCQACARSVRPGRRGAMVSNYGDRAREWRTSSIPIVPETGRAPRWIPDSPAPDCPPSDWQRGGVDDVSDRADAGLATGLLRRRNDVADRRPSSGLGCRVDDIRAWIDAHPIEACLGQGSAHDPGGAWRADTDASSTDEANSASARRGAVIDWEVAETQVRGIHLCPRGDPRRIGGQRQRDRLAPGSLCCRRVLWHPECDDGEREVGSHPVPPQSLVRQCAGTGRRLFGRSHHRIIA